MNQKNLKNQLYLLKIIKSRVLLEISRLVAVGGSFLILIGILVLLVTTKQNKSNQEIRSQATLPSTEQAKLTLKPQGEFVTGKLVEWTVSFDLETQTKIDGLQLILSLPKEYFQDPQLSPSTDWPVKVGFFAVEENKENYIIKMLLIHKQPGQPIQALANDAPIVNLYATAKKAGAASLSFLDQSAATLYQSTPTQNILSITQPEEITIAPNPDSNQQATITFPFLLQGLTKANVSLATKIWFEPITDEIEPGGQNPEKYELETEFSSDAQGWLTPKTAIDLTPLINKNHHRQRYQVFVKTPVSLRKKIGQFDLEPGNWKIVIVKNGYSKTWNKKPVLVGDFVQTGTNYNVINIFDIVAIKEQYTDLEVPVNSKNSKFDVNHNGKIDILDPGLVLSNWKELFIQGE